MIRPRYFLAILVGKIISFLVKIVRLGGTAAPGLYASKVDKKLLTELAKQLKYSLVVSGTNGKTTTTRILAKILKKSGQPFFHNRTGSNLPRGIISELIKHLNLNGLPKNHLGLWEVDEATLPLVIRELKPKIVVLINLFRDQLDRYGEIDTLAKEWQKALKKLPSSATLILNSDDPTIAWLGKKLKCSVVYFSLKDTSLGSKSLVHASDATMCPNCLSPLNYRACFVSHVGIYQCPKCGSIQPQAQIEGTKVEFLKENWTQLEIGSQADKKYKVKIKLAGVYNLYNILAAFSTALVLNIPPQIIIQAIKSFRPAFGRFEQIKLNRQTLYLLLVKNPTGFNEVMKILPQLAGSQAASCLILLNDLIADGRDISWIWDVDFNNLKRIKKIKKVFISGRRAEEMALRMKYANLKSRAAGKAFGDARQISNLKIEKNFKKAVNLLLKSENKNLFILPTYTAMLEVRKILNKKGLIHSTWKD